MAVEAFRVAEKSVQELKIKLAEAKRDKKSVDTALERAKRQCEGQQKQLRQTEVQLSASNEKIAILKKKLEEVEKTRDQAKKAKDQAEQGGMMQKWLRLRKPSGLRSQRYVKTTAPKYGMRLSTKLGLRLLLYLGGQRVYTTILPSEHLARPTLRLIPPSRWQNWERLVQPRR